MNVLRVTWIVLLIGALSGAGRPASGDSKLNAAPGDTLTGFTLKSIDGKEVSLKQFQGKRPVLLVVGASW